MSEKNVEAEIRRQAAAVVAGMTDDDCRKVVVELYDSIITASVAADCFGKTGFKHEQEAADADVARLGDIAARALRRSVAFMVDVAAIAAAAHKDEEEGGCHA